jgi:cell division septum initiation protein DivIVA
MTTPGEHRIPASRRGGSSRLTPEFVRRIEFARSPLGRRGYLEADVERFRLRTIDEISQSNAEKAELREEIDRLRNYFRRHGFEPRNAVPSSAVMVAEANGSAAGEGVQESNGTLVLEGPSVQAVNMLSQAQQAADQHIAQAEDYTRQLVGNARSQYEQILLEAQRLAEEAAHEASVTYQEATSLEDRMGEHQQLEAKLAYMRTFAQVTQVQMRSILDALREELEALTDIPSRSLALASEHDTGSFPRPRH